MNRSRLLLVLASTMLGASLAACSDSRTLAVRVSIPGADSAITPAAGVALVALPYDRDSVLGALEKRARGPRPATAALDTLFARFREPFTSYARASFAAGKLRDSLALLKPRLDSLPRNGADYRALYGRFAEQHRALAGAEARRDSAHRALDVARRDFAGRGDSLRRAARLWEDSTYRGYDSIVRGLAQRSGQEAVTDTTDTGGWATLTLRGKGPWWIYARSWDANDPNAEWYWNLPAAGDTMQLTPRNGELRAKY